MTWREGASARYGLAAAASLAAIAVAFALERLAGLASVGLAFLLAVLVVALRAGRGPAVATALVSFVAYGFFFVEPRYRLAIARPRDVAGVAALLAAALVASRLASRLRSQLQHLRAAHQHVRGTEELGRSLASAADEAQVLSSSAEVMSRFLGAPVVLLRRGAGPAGAVVAASPATSAPGEADLQRLDAMGQAGRAVRAGGLAAVLLPVDGPALATGTRELGAAMLERVSQALDRTRLVADLEAARVQGQTDQLRTALLSSVSHDLRSPLTAMIGAATSLSGRGEDLEPSERADLLAMIVSEGRRLDRSIQNLLDMTRLGQGPLKMQRDWTALDEIVQAAVSRVREAFADVSVETAVPDDVLLFVHPALVEQALFNVLENAARFTPDGEPLIVRATATLREVTIEVADRGPGIPDDERSRIFDKFYSVRRGDSGSRGGGLGLTICRGMIGAHGGRVEAVPGDGGVGTTFRIRLPRPDPPPGRPEDGAT